ncbi:MAG: ribosomal RNA small subunit methyltransferase A [Candidatus Wallbacteria bacterium]|nr:ribosomal RNA small subunit methyltransferase A [Candidatus Wallbacteria bacterium]
MRSGRPAAHAPPEGFRPSKALGQNFLIDPNLARKLVEALEVPPGGTVLEIGPGTGVLTERLLSAGAVVHAIEKDKRLAALLSEKYAGNAAFRLTVGDALEAEPEFEAGRLPARLISNLPYSVTTPLLLRIVFWGLPLERIVVTVQKEVAERIVSQRGREYGRMSVLIGLYGRAKKLFDLPPQAFRPQPRVRSSALLVEPDPSRPKLARGSWLERLVKAAFSERRKQMAKLVAAAAGRPRADVESAMAQCGIAVAARAEEVSPRQFLELAGLLGG